MFVENTSLDILTLMLKDAIWKKKVKIQREASCRHVALPVVLVYVGGREIVIQYLSNASFKYSMIIIVKGNNKGEIMIP